MNPLTIAYEFGYRSGIEGEDPRVCPYAKMTVEWRAWNEGQRHGANVRTEALAAVERQEFRNIDA